VREKARGGCGLKEGREMVSVYNDATPQKKDRKNRFGRRRRQKPEKVAPPHSLKKGRITITTKKQEAVV